MSLRIKSSIGSPLIGKSKYVDIGLGYSQHGENLVDVTLYDEWEFAELRKDLQALLVNLDIVEEHNKGLKK